MDYRNQSISFWVKALGYLQNFDSKELSPGDMLEETLLKTQKISQDQAERIRFLYIEQCFLQWLVKEARLEQSQSQEYLNKKLAFIKEGGKTFMWSCMENNLVPLHIMKKQAALFYEQKIFTQEDCAFVQKVFSAFQQRPTMEIEEMQKTVAPTMFGLYEILSEIGRGGMGRVYKAFHPKLKKTVAIKVMLKSQNDKNRKRFLSEAQMMAKLNHPNIVPIHDVGSYDDQDYIVMDFIEGEPLSDILKNTKFSTRKALEIMKEVASGMAYAHRNDIIHRDLKPSNIMIEKNTNRPVIMDFGLAKNLKANDDLTKSGEILGTPKYMSPEQVEGKSARITYATDVYSLGAILYEMLTRQEIFSRAETHQIIFKIMYSEIIPPCVHNPLLSKEVESICMKALEKKQENRYKNAQELADDIERFLNGDAILARPPKWTQKLWKKIHKHKIALFLFVFIGLSLIGMGVFFARTKVSWEKDLARNVSLWWEKFEKEIIEDMKFLEEHRNSMEKGKKLVDQTIASYQKWKKIQEENTRKRQLRLKNRPSLIEEWKQKESLGKQQETSQQDNFAQYINTRRNLFQQWKKLCGKKDLVSKYNDFQIQYENLAKDFLEKKEIYQNIEKEMLEKISNLPAIEMFLGKNAIVKGKVAQSFSKSIENYVQKIAGDSLDQTAVQEEEQTRQSWLSSCILILHKEDIKAKKIQNYIKNSTGTQYQSILEKLINQKNLSQNDMMELQDKLEMICLKNFSFAPAYYQIARVYDQNDQKNMAQIYYEMSLEASSGLEDHDNQRGTLDFFTRYYLGKVYYNLWHETLRSRSMESDEEKLKKLNEEEGKLAQAFMQNQDILLKIPADQEQQSYRKMNEFYTLLMQEEKKILKDTGNLPIKGYLHFYIHPPHEGKKKHNTQAIILYARLLEILEGIHGEMFASDVAELKAQIYKDLILLEKESPDCFQEVLKNFQQSVAGKKWNYSSWKELAGVNLILGDYANTQDFYRQGISIHPDASWYYILSLLNQKERSTETMKELEYHLQFYAPEQEEKTDPNLHIMKKNLLGFLYLKENQREKLEQIFPYLKITSIKVTKNTSLSELGKVCLANCLYIIICAKMDKKEEAKNGLLTLWNIALEDTDDWARFKDRRLIKTFLISLNNYHDPFACDPEFRKINTVVENFIGEIVHEKKTGLYYQLADHSQFLTQINEYLDKEVELTQKIQILTRGVVKNEYILPLMLCVLSKIWIDLAEERHILMEYPACAEMHYRRAIAHYRRYLHAQEEIEGKRHLQKALKNLELAMERNPSHALYHYAKSALLAHYDGFSNPLVQEEILFHLRLAFQLGWNKPKYIEKEIAFKGHRDIIKEKLDGVVPLQQESFSDIAERVARLKEKGLGKQAIFLLQCYEEKIQQEKETKESFFLEEIEKNVFQELRDSFQNRKEILRKVNFFPPEKHKQFFNKLVHLYLEKIRQSEESNQPQEVQKYFQEAIRIHPESWLLYLNRALFYEKQGKKENFYADWQKALSLTPYTAMDWISLNSEEKK